MYALHPVNSSRRSNFIKRGTAGCGTFRGRLGIVSIRVDVAVHDTQLAISRGHGVPGKCDSVWRRTLDAGKSFGDLRDKRVVELHFDAVGCAALRGKLARGGH